MADDFLMGSVINGKYTKTDKSNDATKTTQASSSLSAGSKGTSYDKDMFLQLLTAEMQYQDPLEPTSNTEYVSELASFSQIEAIQSVNEHMSSLQANSLVGKTVGLVSDNQEIMGVVDYVTSVDGDMFLSVNGKLYGMDTLDTVMDTDYYQAGLFADSFHAMVNNMPNPEDLSLASEKDLQTARTVYDGLSQYYKSRIAPADVTKLETLEKRMAELKAQNKAEASDSNDTENDTESDSKTEATE